jgi:Flp pilus assembly protein TadG
MRRHLHVLRQFIAARRGVAAIEFAIMLPVLAVLFLATIDAGRAIAIYMKVRSATYVLDTIANQYSTIQSSDMSAILGATSVVLAPYASSPVQVVISQVAISSSGSATVDWSATLNGTALTAGSSVTVPTALATPSSYLIYGQVTYTYTPLFGFFLSGGATLSDNLFVTPRSTSCIIYVPATSSACGSSSSSSGGSSSGSGSSGSGSSGSSSSGSGSSGSGSSGSGSSGGSGGWGGWGGWFGGLF